MSRRQEPCRHFLRGNCRFGANCRYLHASPDQNQYQNQTKPSTNSFGFGASQFSQQHQHQHQQQQQQQQQKPNPFGFGVQNKNSTSQFQPPSKPFENKWTRSTSTASKQTDSQTQASVHTCTDPESCKNIIADDFKNEAPLWKLTCYGHYKNLPCDIHGDISSEELRALAYEEAKQGRTLQSIIERERNLLQSKLSEFDNLLRKPSLHPNSNLGPTSQSNAAPAFTNFSQLGSATNVTSAFRPPVPLSGSNNLFGQPSFLQNNSQMSTQPEMKFSTSVGTFGSPLTNQNQAFGSLQAPARNFSFGTASNTNANGNTSGAQPFTSSFPHSSIGNSNASNKQQQGLSSLGLGFASASPPSEEKQEESKDDGIWLKEKWSLGEIPECTPPLRYCR